MTVYGGYSGDFSDRDTTVYETAIMAVPTGDTSQASVRAVGLTANASGLAGFSICGLVNQSPGGNSVAAFIADCDDTFVFTDNRVYAGSGGAGSPGAPGSGACRVSGTAGVAPADIGKADCGLSDHSVGGAGGVLTCGDVSVSGGGGSGVCLISISMLKETRARLEPTRQWHRRRLALQAMGQRAVPVARGRIRISTSRTDHSARVFVSRRP